MTHKSKILWGITAVVLILMNVSFLVDDILRWILISTMLVLVGIEIIISIVFFKA